MLKKLKQVYQFKIVLPNIHPPIWRRIQVPAEYNFWDLHVAIQDAMGWLDCHLHQFELFHPETMKKERVGIPEDVYDVNPIDYETLPGWELKLGDCFTIPENEIISYLYDFGDGWEHLIHWEGAFPRIAGQKYPRCLGGECACPPEDCGGLPGYERFLEAISDPNHQDYPEMIQWIGGHFDPESFDFRKVRFHSPKKRWKEASRVD